jgi:hypothetical protein
MSGSNEGGSSYQTFCKPFAALLAIKSLGLAGAGQRFASVSDKFAIGKNGFFHKEYIKIAPTPRPGGVDRV